MGCSKKAQEQKENDGKNKISINMIVPDGLPAISVAKLIKENPEIDKNLEVNYDIEKGTDTLVSKVLKGEGDICIVPSNLAATAYEKGLGYKLVSTIGFGSFYLIGNERIDGLKNLSGKEIYNIGQGLTPDLTFKALLEKNSVNPDKDVTLNYVNSATEIAPLFLEGKAEFVVVPEPMLTQILDKKPETNIIASLNDEWKKIYGTKEGYPQSSLIIKEETFSKNPEAIKLLLSKIEETVTWTNENKKQAAEYAEELQITGKKEIIKKSLERANLKYTKAVETREDYDSYYNALFKMNSKTVGGRKVDGNIFFEK